MNEPEMRYRLIPEPSFDELLADGIMDIVLENAGISRAELRRYLEETGRRRDNHSSKTL
jgi:hypothetical protein